jgi:hypothetical protein
MIWFAEIPRVETPAVALPVPLHSQSACFRQGFAFGPETVVYHL